MAIQYEIEALIVDTPFICILQIIRTEHQVENKENIMLPIVASLIKLDILKLLKGKWQSERKNIKKISS